MAVFFFFPVPLSLYSLVHFWIYLFRFSCRCRKRKKKIRGEKISYHYQFKMSQWTACLPSRESKWLLRFMRTNRSSGRLLPTLGNEKVGNKRPVLAYSCLLRYFQYEIVIVPHFIPFSVTFKTFDLNYNCRSNQTGQYLCPTFNNDGTHVTTRLIRTSIEFTNRVNNISRQRLDSLAWH